MRLLWKFLINLNIFLPYDPPTQRDMKTCVQTKTCIYSNLSHPLQRLETTHMSFDRWMSKQIVLRPHSAIKRSELFIYAPTWMSLKVIFFWMREASLKRLHTIWSHLYDILKNKQTKLRWWRMDQWLPEIGS